MTSIWIASLGTSFERAFDLLAGAIRDCSDRLWVQPMWPNDTPEDLPMIGPDGAVVTEPGRRDELFQQRSAPWNVAWHALDCLDYDLTGELAPWSPPPPFAGHPHWMFTALPRPWSREEMTGYVDYCRQRVRDALADMTDEKGATPLPAAHRYAGTPHAEIITSMVGHTVEHAAQIRQFITAAA